VDLLEYHKHQFAYDDWANLTAIASLEAIRTPPARAVRFMAHIVGAESLWLARLTGAPAPLPVWPDLTPSESRAHVDALRDRWRTYLHGLTSRSLEERASYINTKGEPWTNGVGDILTHVVLHSAYHRGQIATEVRASGHEPAYTDYIHAIRQGLVR
jgi:uncharacterized damage-inducible protein DinB